MLYENSILELYSTINTFVEFAPINNRLFCEIRSLIVFLTMFTKCYDGIFFFFFPRVTPTTPRESLARYFRGAAVVCSNAYKTRMSDLHPPTCPPPIFRANFSGRNWSAWRERAGANVTRDFIVYTEHYVTVLKKHSFRCCLLYF